MFDKIFNIFKTPKQDSKKIVRAKYDAAQTTRDNIKHWSNAENLSADEEARPEIRHILRKRSRYEIANNSYAKGLVQMLANDTIGTGPRIQVLTDNDELNDKIENAFFKWSLKVHLQSKLHLMRVARCQDGESFAVLTSNPKLQSDVKLDFTVIESDRIEGDDSFNEENNSSTVDGITYDQWGNAVSYRVLKFHPSDSSNYLNSNSAITVPAEQMIHVFRQDRPGLHRGIPEITPALPLFAQLRRYNLAVLSAAESAADFAAILYTDTPPNGEADSVDPMDTIPLERNMMLTVPAGWKLGQLDPKHPSANHAEFVKIILSEIARCVCSTYGSVAGDFSGFNYASGRLDNQIYQKSILVDRKFWEMEVLSHIFDSWYREYALINRLPKEPPTVTWFWDAFMHVDPSKEANAQAIKLATHTTTLAAEYAQKGLDWRTELLQRAKELKLMRELGITQKELKNNDEEIEEETEDNQQKRGEDNG